ncbi:alpha/beta fold hydrolase BchO [Bradyrhizobium oligotrophicum]|uniref:alpha/beta fold hydrolase BchO n=1 Tax=Bradyrhizobium oligotrophicum TaxID=44255 RepID=UPI003EBD67BE
MSDKPNWSIDGKDWPNRAASRFVDAAGLRWHVQIMGEGPVALLAHGTGAATHSWRDLAPLLARRFTVVAPDLSGHGFTATPHWQRLSLDGMARDLAVLCEQLAIEPDIAIGHSAGAAILTRMTLDGLMTPKLIVSLNGAYLPFGGVAAQFLSPLAKMMALNPLVPRLFAWRGRDPAAVHRLLKGTGSTIDAAGERLYRRLVGSPGHVAAALEMMANWDLHPLLHELPRLRTALLLIAATHDRAIPPDVARRVQQLVPQARLELIDCLGHLAHEEQPARIAGLIVQAAERAEVLAVQQEMSS